MQIPVRMKIPARSEEEQVRFFNQCLEAYKKAADKSDLKSYTYDIAGTMVCIQFAGEALIKTMTRALEHLRVKKPTKADCTILAWDSQSTGVEMVPPPCKKSHFTDRGDIWGFNSKRIKTAFHWSEFSVNVMDVKTKTAVYWVNSAGQFPYWVQSSPFRTIFHWWMEENNAQLLHAAAVGTEDGAVLITGKGGVGKSTSALACLNAGMDYYADDYLIVKKDPIPIVYSLYSTGKMNRSDQDRFPALRNFASDLINEEQEKDVFYFYPSLQNQIKKSSPVKAILEPKINHRKSTTYSNISYWHIQRALSFTTMSQLPGVGSHTHDFINDLCTKIPCYKIEPGTNMKEVPTSIGNFIKNPHSFVSREKVFKKEELPLVTVIIPVYNGEKFIENAIQNVINQRYPALEIIVVNDGSTDKTEEAVNSLQVDIRCFKQDNMGPSSARNWGIKDASGEYIAFLDVDDMWPENNLHLLVEELEKSPETDIIRGHAQLYRKNTNNEVEYLGDPKESFKYYIGAGLYRKSVFEKVGLFDRNLLYGEDTDWYYRAMENRISVKWMDEITLFVQRHGKNMTEGKNILELNKLKTFKKVLDRDRQRYPDERVLKKHKTKSDE